MLYVRILAVTVAAVVVGRDVIVDIVVVVIVVAAEAVVGAVALLDLVLGVAVGDFVVQDESDVRNDCVIFECFYS